MVMFPDQNLRTNLAILNSLNNENLLNFYLSNGKDGDRDRHQNLLKISFTLLTERYQKSSSINHDNSQIIKNLLGKLQSLKNVNEYKSISRIIKLVKKLSENYKHFIEMYRIVPEFLSFFGEVGAQQISQGNILFKFCAEHRSAHVWVSINFDFPEKMNFFTRINNDGYSAIER